MSLTHADWFFNPLWWYTVAFRSILAQLMACRLLGGTKAAFENVACKMSATLFEPEYVTHLRPRLFRVNFANSIVHASSQSVTNHVLGIHI